METWKTVWEAGISPCLSLEELEALEIGLKTNDGNLIQRTTTYPTPTNGHWECKVECCCPLSYCGWKTKNIVKVVEVFNYFSNKCREINKTLGYFHFNTLSFIEWFDRGKREIVFKELLKKVQISIERKKRRKG